MHKTEAGREYCQTVRLFGVIGVSGNMECGLRRQGGAGTGLGMWQAGLVGPFIIHTWTVIMISPWHTFLVRCSVNA